MNKTYGDLISSIRSMFKLVSSDNVITNRVIAEELQTVNVTLCTQQLQKRNGWNSPNLFTILSCIPMEEVPIYNCCGNDTPCTISKSTIDIPRIVDVNNNLVVQGVWSIDKGMQKGTKFKEIGTFDRYSNYLRLYPENSGNAKFFWFEDNRLCVSDHNIEELSMSAFFADIVNPQDYSCSGAPECPINPMDLEFKTLPKLEMAIKMAVRDSILKDYKQSKQDTTSNDLDDSK